MKHGQYQYLTSSIFVAGAFGASSVSGMCVCTVLALLWLVLGFVAQGADLQ
jgi:hypothetical protein